MPHYPCPAMPVHTIRLFLVYCWQHRGWAIEVERTDQFGDTDVRPGSRIVTDVGPFYTLEELERIAADLLSTALRSPGAPWD